MDLELREGKIYLINGNNELYYYGSTFKSLDFRYKQHKNLDKNKCRSKIIFQVYEENKIKIDLIETFYCYTKEELYARERYYIQNNKCINRNIPYRTKKEKIKKKEPIKYKKNKDTNNFNEYIDKYLEYTTNKMDIIYFIELYEHYYLNMIDSMSKNKFYKKINNSDFKIGRHKGRNSIIGIKFKILEKDKEKINNIKDFCNNYLELENKRNKTRSDIIYNLYKDNIEDIDEKEFIKFMFAIGYKTHKYNGILYYKLRIRDLKKENCIEGCISDFLIEYFEITNDKNDEIRSSQIYELYKLKSEYPLSQQKFNKQMLNNGFIKYNKRNGKKFVGLKYKEILI